MTAAPIAWLAVLAALQDPDAHDDHLARLEELVAAYPLGILTDPVHDLTRWAKGLRAAGAGDSVGALHHFAKFRVPVLARMSAAERIEAAVRAGTWQPPTLDPRADTFRRRHQQALGARHRREWFGATVLLGLAAEIATRESRFLRTLTTSGAALGVTPRTSPSGRVVDVKVRFGGGG